MTEVRIKKIAIRKGDSPAEFDMEPGPVNLVYGPNESGKTAIVEFILGSVFKTAGRRWSLREFHAGRGSRVVLSGTGEEDEVFTPSRRDKLDDIWVRERTGLPPNMAKLLVVKGAELELSAGGASRDVLKEYLSSESILDSVSRKISATLADAVLVDGEPRGAHRGELSERKNRLDKLESLKAMLFEADRAMSGARRELLKKEQQDIRRQINAQNGARRHKAFRLNSRIEELDRALLTLPPEVLRKIHDANKAGILREGDLEAKMTEYAEESEASKEYEWLQEAVRIYEAKSHKIEIKADSAFLVAGLSSLAAAVLFAFLGHPLLCAGAVAAGSLFGLLYLKSMTRSIGAHAPDAGDMKRIETGFRERFGKDMRDEAARNAVRKAVEKAHDNAERIRKETGAIQKELREIGNAVDTRLAALGENASSAAEREAAIERLSTRRSRLEAEKSEAERELAVMMTDPSEYLEEDPGTAYDAGAMKRLEEDLSKAGRELEEEERSIADITARVQQAVSQGSVADPLEELVKLLRDKYSAARADFRKFEAGVIADILVSDVISGLRRRGDQQINEGLSSPEVRNLLKQLTGRYASVSLDEEAGLLVTDGDGVSFKLDGLSTGAREQVLLALRMGFAAGLAGRGRLFLILDDAFQHSDYERRERLVEQVFALGKTGWQVIYFTMDDHIRELFRKKGAMMKNIE